ncbi:MAG: DUF4330 domain-containing protein [Clostridiales bacterium]|nr:MAG: DUF4330 domain-containing protein [Clostridiales bacterium]
MSRQKEVVNKADGSLTSEVEVPDRYDVYITVKGSGTANDTGYFLDGTYQIGVFRRLCFRADTSKRPARLPK